MIIKLFTKQIEFYKSYMLTMLKFKEITMKGKLQNLVENPSDGGLDAYYA